jgi:hypothetical protein
MLNVALLIVALRCHSMAPSAALLLLLHLLNVLLALYKKEFEPITRKHCFVRNK